MGAFALFALAPGGTLFTLGILHVPLLTGVTVAAIALLAVRSPNRIGAVAKPRDRSQA